MDNNNEFLLLTKDITNFSLHSDYVSLGNSFITLTKRFSNLEQIVFSLLMDKSINWQEYVKLGDFFLFLEDKYCRKDDISDSSLREFATKFFCKAYILCPKRICYKLLVKAFNLIDQKSSFSVIKGDIQVKLYYNSFIEENEYCVDNDLYYKWGMNSRSLRYARLIQYYLYLHIQKFKSFYNIYFDLDEETIQKYKRNILPASDKEIKNATNTFFKKLFDEISDSELSKVNKAYEDDWEYDVDNNRLFIFGSKEEDYDYLESSFNEKQ